MKAIALLIVLNAAPGALDPTIQSADSFRAAVDDDSTSPTFVMITVTDSGSRRTKTRCVPAPFLLGALHVEHSLPYDDRGTRAARDLALAAAHHHFDFAKPTALRNVGFTGRGAHDERACDIIRRGHTAVQIDITGETRDMTLAP